MLCRVCGAVPSKGNYCDKCLAEGVTIPCYYCGESLTIDAKKYVQGNARNPERGWVHEYCKSAWLKEYVWTTEKRSKAGKATRKRLESEEYRKKHKEKTAQAFQSEALRNKCSESAKKRFSSEKQREQVSQSLKRYYSNPKNRERARSISQAFWDSDAGTVTKEKISDSLNAFWTEEQRQLRSKFLQEFYRTESGIQARQAMTEGRIALYSGEAGEQFRARISAKLVDYYSDDSNREKSREAALKFWRDPANAGLREQITAKVKAVWESDKGLTKKSEMALQRQQIHADKELDEIALNLMQLYWEDKTVDELQKLHQEAHLKHTDSSYLANIVEEIKSSQGECTRLDLSRATGLAYTTIVKSSTELTGISEGSSMLQQDVLRQVRTFYTGEIQENVTPDFLKLSTSRGQELDIYIPEKKLAIEVNGTYWHSEQQGKDKQYHYTKSKLCREAGVRLIHVWEHEWNNDRQRPILESIIKSALGLSKTLYARKLQVQYRKSVELRDFFETNNIQGFRGGMLAVCLVDPSTNEVLLAYLIGRGNHFSKGYNYEVIRGACKLGYNVVGGFSKAFTHLFKDHPEIDNIVYYIDYNYFDGKSLQANPDWLFKSENISFKNYFVSTGEVKNRNPSKHKEITQGYKDGSILKLWNAGVASYVYNRK